MLFWVLQGLPAGFSCWNVGKGPLHDLVLIGVLALNVLLLKVRHLIQVLRPTHHWFGGDLRLGHDGLSWGLESSVEDQGADRS